MRAPLSTKDQPGLLWAQGLVYVALLSTVMPCAQKPPNLAPTFQEAGVFPALGT